MLFGEGLAVAALVTAIGFVVVDVGGPARLWHLTPVIGIFNWPRSMLAWDILVLNGYLVLNLADPVLHPLSATTAAASPTRATTCPRCSSPSCGR